MTDLINDLEPKVCDLAIMATIAADIINSLSMGTTPEGDWIVPREKLEKFCFAVNQVETQAEELRKAMYAAFDEEKQGKAPKSGTVDVFAMFDRWRALPPAERERVLRHMEELVSKRQGAER